MVPGITRDDITGDWQLEVWNPDTEKWENAKNGFYEEQRWMAPNEANGSGVFVNGNPITIVEPREVQPLTPLPAELRRQPEEEREIRSREDYEGFLQDTLTNLRNR
jgi:hypothetical protein